MIISDANATYILSGNGDGTFKARRSYAGPMNGLVIQVGDINKDGRADLVIADSSAGGSSTYMMMGNGDGSFKAQTTFAIAGMAGASILSDLNGDGNLDLVVNDAENFQALVFLGNGDGSFKARKTYNDAGSASPLYADLNGDGIGDYAAADNWTGSTSLKVMFGNSDGSFRATTSYVSGPLPFNLYTSDLNGDGHLDLVAANSGNSTSSVLLNNGNGTFRAPTTYANANRIRLGDFNGDGVTDFATTSTNTVGMYLGNTKATPYVSPLDLTTQQGARSALSTLDRTHTRILSELGNIGAFQQRLGTALNNLSTSRENFKAAESRIRDGDIALESANYVRNQILQQAAAAVAAQSNRAPEIVLSLLR